jgi:hypothetical protein
LSTWSASASAISSRSRLLTSSTQPGQRRLRTSRGGCQRARADARGMPGCLRRG